MADIRMSCSTLGVLMTAKRDLVAVPFSSVNAWFRADGMFSNWRDSSIHGM